MDQNGPEDHTRADQARSLLAAGESISSVARALRTNRATVRRWRDGGPSMVQPSRSMVRAVEVAVAARVETLTEAARVQRAIAADLHRNLEVLQEIRDDPDADTSARVRAAMTLLDRGGVLAGSDVRVEVAHSPTPAELAVELLALPGPVADNREAVSK